MQQLVAREREIQILEKLFQSRKANFLAIYGRRRVGKTFLISQFFHRKGIYFELTGIKKARAKDQLRNFSEEFFDIFCSGQNQQTPKNWQEAFTLLRRQVEKIDLSQKVIIFLDELPWLASKRSGFLSALDHVWNRHLSRYPNVILIVCGSAASWILRKIVNDKGGFYGRLTAEIRLQPYSILETERFCKAKGVELGRKQIIELYMAFGGIPKYLDYISRGQSSAQIIQEACFEPDSPLAKEFSRVFSSLFDKSEAHLEIVKVLGKKRSGLSQNEILQFTSLSSGGGFTKVLEELEASGFITFVPNFGKKKREGCYRLIDEYSLFFLTWIQPFLEGRLRSKQGNYWQQVKDSPSYYAWAGYTFEGICLKHVEKIVAGLGLSGLLTKSSGWMHRPKKEDKNLGAQIDLVIERADHCTNLCEIKFTNAPYTITKEYSEKLRWKKECFRQATKTKHSLFTTMITLYGVVENDHYHSSVDNQLTMDVFFN